LSNTATIWNSGFLLMLALDPTSGTIAGTATVDEDLLSSIAITASGGSVAVREVSIPEKYPFIDLGGNQFRLLLELDRAVGAGETVTVDIPASLVSDGTRTNATSSGLSVSNNSANATVGTLLSDSAPIVYVDPTSGNDALAAAVNSGDGYYTKLDAEAGADPENPAGSVQAYKTWNAADNAARGSTSTGVVTGKHFAVLLKRGETIDGATDYSAATRVIAGSAGTQGSPVVYGAYGDEADGDAVIQGQQTASGGAKSPIWVTGSMEHIVVTRGLKLVGGVNASSQPSPAVGFNSSASVERSGYTFIGTEFVGGVYFGSTHSGFRQYQTAFIDCVPTDPDASGNGGGMSGDANWDEFSYRQVQLVENAPNNIRGTDSFHGGYFKNIADLIILRWRGDNISGSVWKIDGCWGVHISGGVATRVNNIANVEANGESAAGFPDNRTKLVEAGEVPTLAKGAYSRWVTIENNLISDLHDNGTLGSTKVGLIGFIGPSYDSTIKNNLAIASCDNIVQMTAHPQRGGSSNGYVQDSHETEFIQNLLSVVGTSTRNTDGIQINPPDTDTFGAAAQTQLGCHGLKFNYNVVYVGAGRTGSLELFAFGVQSGDQDYAESDSAGRCDFEANYNCLYAENGSTNALRNGGSGDLFSDIKSFQADMNSGSGTPMTGNRIEDPGIVDASYEISDYLLSLGYADLDEAFDAIVAAVKSGTVPPNLTTQAIADAVLPRHVPDELNALNYAGTAPGFVSWQTEQATPVPSSLPRVPLMKSGDVVYDSDGEPMYDGGVDLTTGTNTANVYGHGEVFRFLLAREAVRIAVTTDSQGSGGYDRMIASMLKMWQFLWSAVPVSAAAAQDPFYIARRDINTALYCLSSQYHTTDTLASDESTTVADLLAASGLDGFDAIPLPFTYVEMEDPMPVGALILQAAANQMTTPSNVYFDADNFNNTFVKFTMLVLAGGETDLDDGGGDIDLRAQVEYYNTSDAAAVSDKTVTVPGEDAFELSEASGNAKLSPIHSDVVEVGVSGASDRPKLSLYDNPSSFDGKKLFVYPGIAERYEDATTPEENVGIYLVRSASGRNPEAYIAGGDNGNPASMNLATDYATRSFIWNHYKLPNLLMYSFGHNSPVRQVSNRKAESQSQADFFDMIYQDAMNVRSLGVEPYILVHLTWAAGNMDQTRHDEQVGAVDALLALGFKVDVIDNFNYRGGATFDESFALDGSNLHPNSQSDAREAYDLYDLIVEGAETLTVPNSLPPARGRGSVRMRHTTLRRR
jgi:hypothetical protein